MKINILVRQLHYYSSMACCCLLAFYACSGFIATHADWFTEGASSQWEQDLRPLQAAIPTEEGDARSAALREACRALVPQATTATAIANDDWEEWFLVRDETTAIRCVIDNDQQAILVHQLHDAPEAGDHDTLAAAIADRHGGSAANLRHDEDNQLLRFDLESVWFDGAVTVLLNENLYDVRTRSVALLRAITDLHRGKHANGFQTLLADATAILLFFVTISGVLIGFQFKKRRHWALLGLGGSFVLALLLLVGR